MEASIASVVWEDSCGLTPHRLLYVVQGSLQLTQVNPPQALEADSILQGYHQLVATATDLPQSRRITVNGMTDKLSDQAVVNSNTVNDEDAHLRLLATRPSDRSVLYLEHSSAH